MPLVLEQALERALARLRPPPVAGAKKRWVLALWVMLALAVATLLGQVATVFGTLFEERPLVLVALPLVMLLGLVFVLNRPALLFAILLTRAGLDPILELTKLPVGDAGLGLGAILNGLILMLTVSMLLERGTQHLRHARMFLPFVLIMIAGVFRSPMVGDAVKLSLAIITAYSAFVIGSYMSEGEHGPDKVMRLVVWSSFLPVGMGVVMAITGTSFSTSQSFDSLDGAEGNRFAGPFTHPNILAFYCVVVVVALLYLWRSQRLSERRWVNALAPWYMLCVLALLALTKTRSAWAGCVAVFFFYGLMFERRFLLYLLLGLVASLAIPSVQERVVDIFSGNEYRQYAKLNSYAWRALLWQDALKWLPASSYPFGEGFQAFPFYSKSFFTLSDGRVGVGAHNVYMQVFFELGAVGILAMVGLYLRVGVLAWRVIRHQRLLGGCGLILMAIYALVCYSDNMLSYLVVNLYLWLMLGAIIPQWALAAPAHSTKP
jgi:putative inorganic carbon (HCO3(-)) transporter